MTIWEERFELVADRIRQHFQELDGEYKEYEYEICGFFDTLIEIIRTENPSAEQYRQWNRRLYEKLEGNQYETSFYNYKFMTEQFGEKMGRYLCWYITTFRWGIPAAYEKDLATLVPLLELYSQLSFILAEEEDKERSLKETMYYYIHDYEEERAEKSVRCMLLPEESKSILNLIMESDFSNSDYLYRYGEYITENEIRVSQFLYSLPEKTLADMARTYTEGYRKGFEVAGIDLGKKKTVQIRYHIGFEPMVRQAIRQFRDMGLEPVFNRKNCITTTAPNRQYGYDHRFDDALYLNKAIVSNRLQQAEAQFEKYKKQALEYAGPAVIEVFGEKLFSPETKKESPSYTKEQEKLSVEYARDYSLMVNRYIPQDNYSFTIIAYPIPEIGKQFEDIFRETVAVNTLDMVKYQKIQQKLIDALDEGEYVHVTGREANHTDIKVQLHQLKNKATETNFENCLADVNIPVGEVFTSPVLTGTKGIIHVTQVYLNGLRYENLELTFEDGMITNYSCSNYKTEEENKKFIKENVLHNRETLPMGEFAIGTNTTAFVMGRKYGIEAKLPILIAEKTGPHFAVGDTCYSMSEDVVLHNPDGKEIIAKENECSALRHTDMEKAYFNCHTDITIPYDELGNIVVHTKEGNSITLIKEGRFVLPGTEELNKVLEEL